MNYPKVSIIILNWNGFEDTIECLESLKKITYPNYEVIIVDNASSGDDVKILRGKYEDCIHIIANDQNYGFAEGNNIGIRHVLEKSGPDYILLLNNDMAVHPQFLDELVKVAGQDYSIGIAGAKVYSSSSRNRLQFTTAKVNLWTGRIVHVGAGEMDTGQYDNIQETDYCHGSCFLIRRDVIKRIGMLDVSYFAYWEEIDYCLRARKEGFRTGYCPRAKVWHKDWSKIWDKGRPSNKTALVVYHVTRNRFLLIRKHASKLQAVTFLLYYFAFQFWFLSGVYLVYHRSLQGFTSFLRGFKDGLQLLMT